MGLTLSAGKKEFLNTFLLVILYAAGLYGIQFFLYKIGVFSGYPATETFVRWDAGWYRSIGLNGYSFNDSGQSNAGFYFLMAAIWKLAGSGGWDMCVVNTLFFATGFSILSGMFKLSTRDKLLWLSLPCVFFAFIPYSEALFFLLSTLCILGIKQQKTWLIWVSLFLLSLTRATALFVIPAFLCMELISNNRKDWLKSLGRYALQYVLPCIAGTAAFVLIQYQQTHVWFAYFIAQSNSWKRIYGNPLLPLTNGSGNITMWLNALAVFACLVSFIFFVIMGMQWLIKNRQRDKTFILSFGYLSAILFSSLFYSPKWVKDTTDVIGTFRYAMITPFFYVFLHYFTKEVHYKLWHYIGVFLFASAAWMAFGAYLHIDYFLFFTTNTIMIIFYMLSANKKLEWPVIVLIALNVLLQVHLFQHFISGNNLVD